MFLEINLKIHSLNCLSCFYSYFELQDVFILRNLFCIFLSCRLAEISITISTESLRQIFTISDEEITHQNCQENAVGSKSQRRRIPNFDNVQRSENFSSIHESGIQYRRKSTLKNFKTKKSNEKCKESLFMIGYL